MADPSCLRHIKFAKQSSLTIMKKMKKKMKVGGVVIALAIITITVAAYLAYKEKNKAVGPENCDTCRLDDNLTSEVKENKNKETPTTAQTPTDLNYSNSDYGFEIKLTEVWRDSVIEEEDASGAIKKIVFYFKTKDKRFESSDYLASALSFYIYEKSKWEQADPSSRSSTEITSNDKYVFSYSVWESPPQDLEHITEKELADVIGTFKLEK